MARAGFDRVIPIDRRHPVHIDERYDAVIDLQGKLRTRALARRIAADRRVTLRKRSAGRAVLSLFGYDRPIADRHNTAIYLGALDRLGIGGELDRAPRLLRNAGPEGLAIGFAPGATHATKRWSPERFGELADRLQEELPEATFVPVGGPSDRELLARAIGCATRARFEPDTTGLDVTGLAERLERLALLVSVDTGPAHIAAALGVPVVVLFGPTSPVRWGPIGVQHRALSLALECSPCSNVGQERCPLPDRSHACMRDLSVDRVLEAALSALGRRP
jgi:ADP-heptose:LPS heptosyltransferase